MISYEDSCTGCSACVSICPKRCIELKINNEGFLIPEINSIECIQCGMCDKVCTIKNITYHDQSHNLFAYVNSESAREKSTSGGFFSLISDYVLDNKGVVYGAKFDDNFNVVHDRAENKFQRDAFRHSKYVQSNLNNIFISIRNDLLKDVLVLFSGTPCQVSGLNNYLKVQNINTEKLITCDFICHGTPSPLIWQEYLKFIMKKYNDKIVSINFRNKENGWHQPLLAIEMNKHFQKCNEQKDPFYQLFYSNCILRKSCHICNYTRKTRVSDITMGDCWGIEKSRPNLDDNKGMSLVLVNSEKGNALISKFKKNSNEFISIEYSDISQPHLERPAKISRKREAFWKQYYDKGFIYILKKYGNYSIKSKVFNFIKRGMIKIIR